MFFEEVSVVEFLTGTEWTPLFAEPALRRPAAAERHDAASPRSRWSSLYRSGSLAAIYLSEYAPSSRARQWSSRCSKCWPASRPSSTATSRCSSSTPDIVLQSSSAATSPSFNALAASIAMGDHDPAAGLVPERGRDAGRAQSPARGRLRSRREPVRGCDARRRAGGACPASSPPSSSRFRALSAKR